MKRSKRGLMVGSALLGLSSNMLICNTLGLSPSAQASTLRHVPLVTYCNTINGSITDHYDYWTESVPYANYNFEAHYRLNSDCSFKAYYDEITGESGGGGGGGTSPYLLNAELYNGNAQVFDADYWGCTTNPPLYSPNYFGQTSASLAPIFISHYYYTDSACSNDAGSTEVSHTFDYQP